MTKYDASSIDVHLGLDAVRQNLNIYLGNPDSDGILHTLVEIFQNSNDEAKAGHGKYFGVSIADDGYFWVYDAGRGIPIDVHPKTKQSTLTTVLTNLSAGGKMRSDKTSSYAKGTGGVHGMGAAVVNAASEHMIAYVFRNGQWYTQSYKKGKVVNKVTKCKAPVVPGAPDNLKRRKSGTTIAFKPDYTLFDKGSKLNLKELAKRLDLTAYLSPKVKIYLSAKGKQAEFYHPDGFTSLIKDMMRRKEVEPEGKPFKYESEDMNIEMQWTSYDEESIVSFVNGGQTTEHGTHVLGLNRAMGEAFKSFKTAKSTFKTEDLRIGLMGVFNFNIRTPRFSGQTKTKLITPEATDTVFEQLVPALKKFFDSNKSLVKYIIKRAQDLRDALDEFKMSKQAASKLKTKVRGRTYLPEMLVESTTKKASERELYIVEGESAKGPCAEARDKKFQEILPLKGKPLNVFKSTSDKIMANKEVINILKAVGYDPANKDPFSKLRVARVIIMADADSDGYHISLLVSAIFYKFLRPMIEQGRIYIADAPLFSAKVGKETFYGESVEILRNKLPKNKKDVSITRNKGLGETSTGILKSVAFDVTTRKLTRLNLVTGDELTKYVSMLDENVGARKTLLGLN